MIRLHNQNRTHTFIDVESGQFISLPKDETDKPPVNADINGLQFFGKSTQDGEPSPDNPVDIVNIPPEFNLTVCRKNLFNKETRTLSRWIARNGTMGSSEISDTTDYIRVEPNTNYFLSGHPNYVSQEIAFYDINKTIITELEGISVTSDNGLKTTPANCYFIRFSMAKTDVATVQFEKGSVATPYQPYQGSTYPYRLEDLDGTLHELCSLPDGTRDRVFYINGKLCLVKTVKEFVASNDTIDNWRYQNVNDDVCLFYISDFEQKWTDRNKRTSNCYCNIVKRSIGYLPYTCGVYEEATRSGLEIGMLKSELTNNGYTLNNVGVQNWVSNWINVLGKSITFSYQLAKPQIIPIKRYGETYDGQVWPYNQKPKSIQYHTNIFTDVGAEMQCEVRKLGNRKMSEFYWVTENGDYIVTDDNDYIMLEY